MNNTPVGKDFLDSHLSMKQIIPWVGAIVVAIALATYTITKLSIQSHILALEEKLDGARDSAKEAENEISRLKTKKIHNTASQESQNYIQNTSKEIPKFENIVERIDALEKERNILLQELASKSQDSLDPKSELMTLISGLSSDNFDIRAKSVRGLFELKDKKAFNSLVAYFHKYPDEATDIEPINGWYDELISINEEAAAEFIVKQLESEMRRHSYWAYDALQTKIREIGALQNITKDLEYIAFRSSSTLARTRAKLLLKSYGEKLDKDAGDQE